MSNITRLLGAILILLLVFFGCYSNGCAATVVASKQVTSLGEADITESVTNELQIHFDGVEDITEKLTVALNKGGTIRISGGTGIISRPLVITRDNTHIILDDSTVLKWDYPKHGMILRTIYALDKTTILDNITVEGGIWEMGGADYDLGGGPAIMMIGVTNLRVSNIVMYDPYKFFFGFGGIDGFEISNIKMNLRNTTILGKDGLHFAGGVRNGTISNIRGNTTDDLIALNFGGDIVGGIENSQMMFQGDSYNVTVTNVYSDNSMESILLLADDIHECTDIFIDGVYGIVNNHSCISISGWRFEGHTANFGNISLSNIHVRTPNTIREGYEAWNTPIVLVGNHWDRIVPCSIKCLTIKGCVVTQSKGMIQTPIRVIGNSTIDSLIIDGLVVYATEDVDLSERAVIDIGYKEQNAIVKNLLIKNSYIARATTPFKSLIRIENNNSTVERATIINNVVGTVLPKKSRRISVKKNILL